MHDLDHDFDQDVQLALFDVDEDGNPDIDPELFESGGWYPEWNPMRDIATTYHVGEVWN